MAAGHMDVRSTSVATARIHYKSARSRLHICRMDRECNRQGSGRGPPRPPQLRLDRAGDRSRAAAVVARWRADGSLSCETGHVHFTLPPFAHHSQVARQQTFLQQPSSDGGGAPHFSGGQHSCVNTPLPSGFSFEHRCPQLSVQSVNVGSFTHPVKEPVPLGRGAAPLEVSFAFSNPPSTRSTRGFGKAILRHSVWEYPSGLPPW